MTEATTPARILVIDDSRVQVMSLKQILEQAKYLVDSAPDGEKGLETIDAQAFNLVLLDMTMPGMDGMQVLRKIRAKSSVPVIMLTALDRSDLAVQSLRLGAFDYITKPPEPKKLLETIELALNESGASTTQVNQISHYRLGKELGRGGMGAVYEAEDMTLERPVALKVLLPELAADPSYEVKFLREAKSAAKLSHGGIVTIFEAGRYRGQLYIAMELVRGTTLAAQRSAGEKFSRGQVVEIILKVAEALQAAHEAGLVHGDIKPANVMMAANRGIKLLDFGLARADRSAGAPPGGKDFMGTAAYASPEQLLNRPLDARSDIHSLGVMSYELLAGEFPFDGSNPFTLAFNVINGKVKKPLAAGPDMPPALSDLVMKMIKPTPDDRPKSMQEVITTLQSCRSSL